MVEDAQRVEEMVVRADLLSLCRFVFFDLYDNIKFNLFNKEIHFVCAKRPPQRRDRLADWTTRRDERNVSHCKALVRHYVTVHYTDYVTPRGTIPPTYVAAINLLRTSVGTDAGRTRPPRSEVLPHALRPQELGQVPAAVEHNDSVIEPVLHALDGSVGVAAAPHLVEHRLVLHVDVTPGLVPLAEDCGEAVVARVADQQPVHLHLGALRLGLCGDHDGGPTVALRLHHPRVAVPDVGVDVQDALVAAEVVAQVLQQRDAAPRRRHALAGRVVRVCREVQAVTVTYRVGRQAGVGEPIARAGAREDGAAGVVWCGWYRAISTGGWRRVLLLLLGEAR